MTLTLGQTHTHTQSFNSLFSRTTWVGRYQKDKPFWILLKQRWWGGSGISQTTCKSFALRSRQTTMPAPHHSSFYRPPNQQRQSTEGITLGQNAFLTLHHSRSNIFKHLYQYLYHFIKFHWQTQDHVLMSADEPTAQFIPYYHQWWQSDVCQPFDILWQHQWLQLVVDQAFQQRPQMCNLSATI